MALKTTQTISFECENGGGRRLDVFLAENLPGLTRSAAQKLLEAGRVTLGGVLVRKNHKTMPGEVYMVMQDEPEDPIAAPQDIPLDIVFEDMDVVIVNKPRGMVVHPAPGHPEGTLVNALLHHCGGSLSGIGGVKRPGIVHRIDKDTSGLMIAAKNDRAHLALAAQLSARTLTREYDAIVRFVMKDDSGTIDAPIGRHPTDRKRQAVYASTDRKRQAVYVVRPANSINLANPARPLQRGNNARPAVTHYEVAARFDGYTHVRCRLETGRTHQIRVHMAHIGHPVLGDIVYGWKKPELGLSGQCLHASRLRFLHPATGEQMELRSSLPGYFLDVLAKLERL